jgi:hypothetical protein
MQGRSDYKDIIKLHKAWADRYMLFWYVLVVTLFAGISFLLENSSVEAAVKTNAYILLAAIVVIGTIWQAAGLTVARVHMLLEGVVPPDAQERKSPPPDVIPGA